MWIFGERIFQKEGKIRTNLQRWELLGVLEEQPGHQRGWYRVVLSDTGKPFWGLLPLTPLLFP